MMKEDEKKSIPSSWTIAIVWFFFSNSKLDILPFELSKLFKLAQFPSLEWFW
jgi:hypothetical protein